MKPGGGCRHEPGERLWPGLGGPGSGEGWPDATWSDRAARVLWVLLGIPHGGQRGLLPTGQNHIPIQARRVLPGSGRSQNHGSQPGPSHPYLCPTLTLQIQVGDARQNHLC